MFYNIPGYSNYQINVHGDVVSKFTHKLLLGSTNPAGYFNYRLKSDNGQTHTWGRHRLLCYVFKHPGVDITNLEVNHINGVKGDDRLDNLEWVTPQENVHHAGKNRLTEKCTPVEIHNVFTNESKYFPSIKACAEYLNLSKDIVSNRIQSNGNRIYAGGFQFRPYKENVHTWPIFEDIDAELDKTVPTKKVCVRNVLTNSIVEYNSITELSNDIQVPVSTLSIWLKNKTMPVLPGFIQIQLKAELRPWRDVIDPYQELAQFTKDKPIIVENTITGETQLFVSLVECAKHFNLKTTTLHYRLKANGRIVYDNCRFRYY